GSLSNGTTDSLLYSAHEMSFRNLESSERLYPESFQPALQTVHGCIYRYENRLLFDCIRPVTAIARIPLILVARKPAALDWQQFLRATLRSLRPTAQSSQPRRGLYCIQTKAL